MSLVIEDGTGLSTAESYISVADATSYFTAYGNLAVWSALSSTTQEQLLRKSSRDLDLLYGKSYLSDPLTSTQALLFPRTTFTDNLGRDVTGIPVALARAVAELAILNNTTDMTGVASTDGNVKLKKTKAGDLEQQIEYFLPTSANSAALRKLNLMLAPYLDGSNSGTSLKIVRG